MSPDHLRGAIVGGLSAAAGALPEVSDTLRRLGVLDLLPEARQGLSGPQALRSAGADQVPVVG